MQANAIIIKTPEVYQTPTTICSVYNPPHQNITVDELSNLFSQLPHPYTVTGDINAHSPIWDSSYFNNRGKL